MSKDIKIRTDVTFAAACARKGYSANEIEKAVNAHSPTGLEHGWKVIEALEDGTSIPAPCLDDPGREHWALEC